MNNIKSYNTVKLESFCEFTEKRSKFIGYIKPTKTENEANEFINKIKSIHKQASHNVYAYRIRQNSRIRFSDDGEPHGTAGIQLLEVLKNQEIFDATIVVTRYFGGTLLGTGGLKRAYFKASKMVVESGTIVVMEYQVNLSVTCDYINFNKILPLIHEQKGVIVDTIFEKNVKLIFHVDEDKLNMLKQKIFNVTCGNAIVKLESGSFYEKK